jgi:hypothetical protein
MKNKNSNEVEVNKAFLKKPLPERIKSTAMKGALSTSLLAIAFTPTVQAYEQAKASGARTVTRVLNDYEPILNSSSRDYTLDPNRRSIIENVGSLGRSQQPVAIQRMDRNMASIIQSTGAVDLDALMNSGVANYNKDKGVLSINMAEDHASNSAFIQMTQQQPLVISAYEPANEMGTIVLIESKRHSDGSATMYMRFISPRYFDEKSSGGGLTEMEHQTMIEQLGRNPVEGNKSGGRYDHSFTSITSIGLQTVAGLVMQRHGGTLGLHTDYNPDVRTWETESGNAFRKKITTHLAVDLHPNWMMLVPKGEFDNGIHPFFTIDNDGETVLVNGGVMSMPVSEFASSFPMDEFQVYYDSMTKTAWTGITLILVTFVIAFATAGVGALAGTQFIGLSVTQVAAISAGVVAGVSAYSGTLTDGVTTSLGNVTAVTNKDSTKGYGGFGDKWHNRLRDINLEGPMSNRYQRAGQFTKEKADEWSHLIDPVYSWNKDSVTYQGTNMKVQPKPDEDKMFDNPYDNPNYGNNACKRIFFGISGGGFCTMLKQYDGGEA